MHWLSRVWDVVIHIDRHAASWSASMGHWFYGVMALVLFCETGLVVMPFLPGDSLLFVLGALAAHEDSSIDPWLMATVLTCATLAGDSTNYWIGRSVGPKVFTSKTSRLLNHAHLIRAERFYEKHGPKTIVLARFIAVIRTFAPFVAGIGRMEYSRFVGYSLLGAVLWVWGLLFLGYWVGNVPWVKANTPLIMWSIMGVTIVLGVVEAIKAKRRKEPE